MKILKSFLLLLVSFTALAQEDDAEASPQDLGARERIKAAHAAYITERLELTPEEAEKFWPIYREYGAKRKELRQQLRNARKSGQDEKTLLDLDLKIKQQELDLEKDYSSRLQNVITPRKLMNLRQAERDFRRLVLQQIQQRNQNMERRQERSQRRPRNN